MRAWRPPPRQHEVPVTRSIAGRSSRSAPRSYRNGGLRFAARIVALAGTLLAIDAGLAGRPHASAPMQGEPDPVVLDLATPPASTTRILGAPAKEQLGNHMAFGDVNADGIRDLLIGAHWASESGRNNAGRAYALLGNRKWPASIDLSRAAAADRWSFMGVGREPRLGMSVAAGDLSGDGIDDVAIGSLLADPDGKANAGAVYVMFGRPDAGGHVDFVRSSPDLRIAGRSDPTGSDQLGTDIAIADLDGDGWQDLAVAAMLKDGPRGGFRGAVFGWWGPLRAGKIDRATDGAHWSIRGTSDRAYLGTVLHVADLDGDRGSELMIGAWTPDDAVGSPVDGGAVYIFDGPTLRSGPEITLGEARATVTGPEGSSLSGAQRFGDCSCHGSPLATGDLTADGIVDLAIGAPQAEGRRGTVFVAPGPLEGHIDLRTAATWKGIGMGADDQAGWAIATGDLDGDGFLDLVVTAPGAGAALGRGDAGVAYGVRGPFSAPSLAELGGAPLKILGAGSGDGKAGVSIGLADTDGDGRDDLHVGMPDADPSGRTAVGEVYRIPWPAIVLAATPTPPAGPSPSPTALPTTSSTASPTATNTARPSSTPIDTPRATMTPGLTATDAPTSSRPNPSDGIVWLPLAVRGR